MGIIRIKELAGAADTGEQGRVVFDAICRDIATGKIVSISFEGLRTATSSFVNVAFLSLLDHVSLDDIKQRLKVFHSTHQINSMIRNRLIEHDQRIAHSRSAFPFGAQPFCP